MAMIPSCLEQVEAAPGSEPAVAPVSGQEQQWNLLGRCTLALLVVGILCRTLRFLLGFPIWGDEASVCLNFLELDYGGLLHQLRYGQVAPLLFLWGELTALRLFGGSEWAMRLLPFLAGLGSLLLFWRLTRLVLKPLEATLALGFLAVAIWPVSMSTLVKPYSLDLFMALALLLPAAHWLRRPRQLGWLVLLGLVTPLAVFSSYPVIFVGGAVSLALLPATWSRGARPQLLWVAYNVTLATCFLLHYGIVGRGQLRTPVNATTTALEMSAYWAEGFPPSSPLALLKWLLLIHTGQMTAYPLGSSNGGSSLTALLCLVGAWQFRTSQRRPLLVLCGAPFVLSFIAAVLHRYPYGASCRLTQYLAPAVCLAAGAGAAALIERLRSPELRWRWTLGICLLFLLVGMGGMIRDLVKPYRDPETRWTYQVMRQFAVEARSGAPIVVLNNPDEVDRVFRWYLALYGDRVSWNGRIDWARAAASREVLGVCYRAHKLTAPEQLARVPVHRQIPVSVKVQAWLVQSGLPWVLKRAVSDTGVPPSWRDPVKHLDQFRWVLE